MNDEPVGAGTAMKFILVMGLFVGGVSMVSSNGLSMGGVAVASIAFVVLCFASPYLFKQ